MRMEAALQPPLIILSGVIDVFICWIMCRLASLTHLEQQCLHHQICCLVQHDDKDKYETLLKCEIPHRDVSFC